MRLLNKDRRLDVYLLIFGQCTYIFVAFIMYSKTLELYCIFLWNSIFKVLMKINTLFYEIKSCCSYHISYDIMMDRPWINDLISCTKLNNAVLIFNTLLIFLFSLIFKSGSSFYNLILNHIDCAQDYILQQNFPFPNKKCLIVYWMHENKDIKINWWSTIIIFSS